MKEIWFLGLAVIGILLLFSLGTGAFTWSSLTNYLQTSGKINLIILIFGTAIIISSLGWLLRKWR